jgi:hypothetical protein
VANPCTPCNCIPYVNRCCCPPRNGISVLQPQCHMVPGQEVPVNNPCFDGTTSYWSYKFFVDCSPGPSTPAMSNFGIPICDSITANQIRVLEKIDGCLDFAEVSFELKSNENPDPNLGPAPEGFQYIKVEVGDRYGEGVCVAYRIEIEGNYPEAIQPIKVKAGTLPVLTFCSGCFIVPGCPEGAQLAVNKSCEVSIVGQQAVLHYNVLVENVGDLGANNVKFTDVVGFGGANITLGDITVISEPVLQEPFNVNVMPGLIEITGELGTIAAGSSIQISQDVEVIEFAQCGTYIFTNIAAAAVNGESVQDECTKTVEVVRLIAEKCSFISNGNEGVFRLIIASQGNCPQTAVSLQDEISVPEGVSVRFTDFGGCIASVPENTTVTGPTSVLLNCEDIIVPPAGASVRDIRFEVLSVGLVGAPLSITNTITDIQPVNVNEQVFLGVENLPVTAAINVNAVLESTNPCQ